METKRVEIPNFNTKAETLRYLVQNKASLISQKKSITKHADGIAFMQPMADSAAHLNAVKAALEGDLKDVDAIQVKAIINTTNVMDSHKDVHIAGLWEKTLQENRLIMHVQEHKSYEFDKIIADGDDLKASAEFIAWSDLGYAFEGKTQALVFDSTVRRDRNPAMFKEYAKGRVRNHSVGMRYVKLKLAIEDKEIGSAEEVETWAKYIDTIANKEDAIAQGYFWAVLEAKAIEGSAVPLGSNMFTPTTSVQAAKALVGAEHDNEQQSKDAAAKALQARKQFYF